MSLQYGAALTKLAQQIASDAVLKFWGITIGPYGIGIIRFVKVKR